MLVSPRRTKADGGGTACSCPENCGKKKIPLELVAKQKLEMQSTAEVLLSGVCDQGAPSSYGAQNCFANSSY